MYTRVKNKYIACVIFISQFLLYFILHNHIVTVLEPLIIYALILYLLREYIPKQISTHELYQGWHIFIYLAIAQAICNLASSRFLPFQQPLAMTLLYVPITTVYILVAPLVEELIFRHIVYGGLSKRYGFYLASIASSALFSLGHMTLSGGIGYFVIGVILCYTYERYGLTTSIAAHTFLNFGVILTQSILMR